MPPVLSIAAFVLIAGCGAAGPPAAVTAPAPVPTPGPATGNDAATQQVAAASDADDDRILDGDDACPAEPETYNGFSDMDGCPDCGKAVIVSHSWSMPFVDFARDSAAIDDPHPIDFAAAVLAAHPEYTLITVRGGLVAGESADGKLATARATAVVDGLVARGIAAARLVAAGATTFGDHADVSFEITERGDPRPPLCFEAFPGCDGFSMPILETVLFSARSSTIARDYAPVLAAVAATLTGHPDLAVVEVIGSAARSERGADAVATRRAAAVIDALVAAGVSGDRLVPIARVAPEGIKLANARSVTFGHVIIEGCRGRTLAP